MTIPNYTPAARVACEILKMLRAQKLQREEVADALGLTRWMADRLLDEFVEHGIVRRELGLTVRATGGRRPYLYYLAAEWGGSQC